jgi:hypothetical protein
MGALFGEDPVVLEETKPKKKKSELFEMIKMMFEQPTKFADIPPHDKAKYFFMMNRFFAIKFPVQAALFNNTKINPGQAVQIWADMLKPLFNTTPSFIFSALKRTKKVKKEKASHKIEQNTISYYAQTYMLREADVEHAIQHIGKPFIDELMQIQKAISSKIK